MEGLEFILTEIRVSPNNMSAAAPAAPAPVSANSGQKKKKNLAIHLMAGGVAGCCEALACHPLDTIKVRLQLRGERAALKNSPAKVAADALKNASTAAAKVFPPAAQFTLPYTTHINIPAKEQQFHCRWHADCSKGGLPLPLQRLGRRRLGHRAQNGHSVLIL